MFRHRLMVVEHPVSRDKGKSFAEMAIHIHSLLGTYHWARLDENHVLLTGNYPIKHHDKLHNMETVSVMPPMASGRTIKEKLKDKHYVVLANRLHLAPEHNMSDLIETAEQHYGPLFSPEK
jgi:hypothetical protein